MHKGQKQRPDHSVHEMTKVASKRIGGCLRAENGRQQKPRDSKH